MKRIVFSLCLLIVFASANATTWFIDKTNGSDSNTGRSASQALQHFWVTGVVSIWDSVAAGDLVLVQPGDYTEFNNFSAAHSFKISTDIPITNPVKWVGCGAGVNIKCNTDVAWYWAWRNQIFYNFNIFSVGYGSGKGINIRCDYNTAPTDEMTLNSHMQFYACNIYHNEAFYAFYEVANVVGKPNPWLTVDDCTFSVNTNSAKHPYITLVVQTAATYVDDARFYFRNNTFIYLAANINAAYSPYVMYIEGANTTKDLYLQRNIFVGGEDAGGEKISAVYFTGTGAGTCTLYEDNNIFWYPSGVVGAWVPILASDGAVAIDATSIVADPRLVDWTVPVKDYNLKSDSPGLTMKRIPGGILPNLLKVR